MIPISDQVYGVSIADVSGKGPGAALLMANLQASLHALVAGAMGISDMVGRINHLIHQNTDLDKYITFFYGQLDLRGHTFTYCNAGHNPPYKVSRDGRAIELMAGGIVLGMMDGLHFETATTVLKPGDLIVMYTDGITEAVNAEDEEFGEARVLELVRKSQDRTAQQLVDDLVSSVKTYFGNAPQADDITVVVIRALDRKETGSPAGGAAPPEKGADKTEKAGKAKGKPDAAKKIRPAKRPEE